MPRKAQRYCVQFGYTFNMDREAFYKKLKGDLEADSKFPLKYLFKFIVPSNGTQVDEVEQMFNHSGAVINKKTSKTGKFTSVSIHVIVNSADQIIAKYKEAEAIEGIISL